MNNLNIKPIKDGNTYKYLGIDKNRNCIGTVNKERVMKEYLTRKKNICLAIRIFIFQRSYCP